MVGVPRSKGCAICIQRRIKCDESRPGCQRCQKRGTACPGYAKDLKIYIYSHPSPSETKTEIKTTPDEHQSMLPVSTLIDGMVAPNLAGMAIAQRYREGFCGFLEATFPGQFYCYSTRVGINWFDVARNYQETAGKALDWSLRSLGALHIGRLQGDDRLGLASREMYGKALNQLARSLRKPALVTADDTLAAAILLGAFEMSCSTGEESWMLHSRGISYLYQIRGPQAHTTGLGRTLFSSFRGFLVYEALVRGERCFLEDEEWGSIIPDVIDEERRLGKFCGLGELIEYSFHEIARCPGFLAATRELTASTRTTNRERENLMISIFDCQRALLKYHSKGAAGIDVSQRHTDTEIQEFFGPIPDHVRAPLGECSLQGITSAIALLQQLLVILRSDASRRSALLHSSNQPQISQWEDSGYPLSLQFADGRRDYGNLPRPKEHETPHTWLDRVSMGMGMLMNT